MTATTLQIFDVHNILSVNAMSHVQPDELYAQEQFGWEISRAFDTWQDQVFSHSFPFSSLAGRAHVCAACA